MHNARSKAGTGRDTIELGTGYTITSLYELDGLIGGEPKFTQNGRGAPRNFPVYHWASPSLKTSVSDSIR